jgi:hypothetical protein
MPDFKTGSTYYINHPLLTRMNSCLILSKARLDMTGVEKGAQGNGLFRRPAFFSPSQSFASGLRSASAKARQVEE